MSAFSALCGSTARTDLSAWRGTPPASRSRQLVWLATSLIILLPPGVCFKQKSPKRTYTTDPLLYPPVQVKGVQQKNTPARQKTIFATICSSRHSTAETNHET